LAFFETLIQALAVIRYLMGFFDVTMSRQASDVHLLKKDKFVFIQK
jgi:hypothetical protein